MLAAVILIQMRAVVERLMKISGRNTEQPRVSGSIAEFQSSSTFAYQRRGSASTALLEVKVKRDAESCLIWSSGIGALLPPQNRQNVKSDLRHEMRTLLEVGRNTLLHSIAWTSP